eukprot:PhM_4_TR18011/c0_g1_i3/m.33393
MALEENMQPELTFRFAETARRAFYDEETLINDVHTIRDVGDYISNTFVKTFFDTFLDRNGNMPHRHFSVFNTFLMLETFRPISSIRFRAFHVKEGCSDHVGE